MSFFCSARFDALALAKNQQEPVDHYLFHCLLDPDTIHGTELPFVFGSKPMPAASDTQVIALFAAYWSGLAANGNPNATGLPAWTPISTNSGDDTLLTIDATPQTITNYRSDKCAFWCSYGLVNGG